MSQVTRWAAAAMTIAVLTVAARSGAAAAPAAGEAAAKTAIGQLERDFSAAWNAHDAKRMASFWEQDGDLINPFGRHAQGRAEIEKLFTDEQTTFFRQSTFTTDASTVRLIAPTVAIADWDVTVTGMLDPQGGAAPPLKNHVTLVLRHSEGGWHAVAARPVVYPPPPGK